MSNFDRLKIKPSPIAARQTCKSIYRHFSSFCTRSLVDGDWLGTLPSNPLRFDSALWRVCSTSRHSACDAGQRQRGPCVQAVTRCPFCRPAIELEAASPRPPTHLGHTGATNGVAGGGRRFSTNAVRVACRSPSAPIQDRTAGSGIARRRPPAWLSLQRRAPTAGLYAPSPRSAKRRFRAGALTLTVFLPLR